MVHNQDWLELDTVLVQRRTQCAKLRNWQCLNTGTHFESHIAAVDEPEFLQAQVLHDNFHWDSDAPSPRRRIRRGRSSMPNSKPCKFVMQKRICMVRRGSVWRGVGSHPLPCKTHAAVKFPAPKLQTLGAFYWVFPSAHVYFKHDIDTKRSQSMADSCWTTA